MQLAIETVELCRRFGAAEAVRGIDLQVPTGSIFGFLGPNGAGKTTTIRMLLGLLRPSGGAIRILGLDMLRQRLAIARATGALVETQSLYDHLTGCENLDISRRLLRLPASEVSRVLDIVDLAGAAAHQVVGYSLGMRQRLVIARALLGEPRLLILDEPGNGLDPDCIRALRDLLRHFATDLGVTVFLSSHQLSEVEQVATHVGLMSAGTLVAQGPLAEVLALRTSRTEVEVDQPSAAQQLLARAGLKVAVHEDILLIDNGSKMQAAEIARTLVVAGFQLHGLRACTATLEDLYVDATRAAA